MRSCVCVIGGWLWSAACVPAWPAFDPCVPARASACAGHRACADHRARASHRGCAGYRVRCRLLAVPPRAARIRPYARRSASRSVRCPNRPLILYARWDECHIHCVCWDLLHIHSSGAEGCSRHRTGGPADPAPDGRPGISRPVGAGFAPRSGLIADAATPLPSQSRVQHRESLQNAEVSAGTCGWRRRVLG